MSFNRPGIRCVGSTTPLVAAIIALLLLFTTPSDFPSENRVASTSDYDPAFAVGRGKGTEGMVCVGGWEGG